MRDYAEGHPERSAFISITDVVWKEEVAPCDDRFGGITARRDGVHVKGPVRKR